MRKRVAVLISGRGSNMAALLYASRLPDCPFEVVLVASNDPDAAGLALAGAEGVPTFAHSHKGLKRAEFDDLIHTQLAAARADYVALAGYMRLLSPEFVAKWRGRMVNIHPSLLPKYKGLDTHARALAEADTTVGCSVHLVTDELDDGPVLGQVEVAVLPGDTPETLAARVLIAEHQLYPRALAELVTRETGRDWILEQVRRRALALPRAAEKLSHGTPGFHIEGGKFFAYFSHDHHGDGITSVLVKTSGAEEQESLIDMDPDTYYKPPYLGPSGWIGIRLDAGDVDWPHVEDRLAQSWRMVAPRKLAELF